MIWKVFLIHFVLNNFLTIEATSKVIGTSCTKDGYNGTCIAQDKCLSVLVDFKEKKQSTICGFEGKEPIICCTDCPQNYAKNVSQIVFNDYVGLMVKDGTKSLDACIDFTDKLPYKCKRGVTSFIEKEWDNSSLCHRIYFPSIKPSGGIDSKRGEHPFVALLGYGDSFEEAEWSCAGTLISDRFILTAAHCISTKNTVPVKFAALGILKRSDPIEIWQKYNIKRIIPHPEYKSPSKYHDIALLETEETIQFNENVLPLCLDSIKVNDYYRKVAYALGWGALGPRLPVADILQQITIVKFADAECSELYPTYRLLDHGFDNETQMCYGNHEEPIQKYSQDTCQGDSGGPLHTEEGHTCVPVVIGVTSHGKECGYRGNAGVYTKVVHYVPWIESIVWP